MRSGLLIAAVAAILALSAGQCQAQLVGFGGSYLYGAGYGLYVYERLPQYSLFPPVYYKHPTPRSYGFSPYAYPPGFTTPDVSATSRRTVIVNDYVPQSSSAKESTNRQPEPLVMSNPYVKSGPHATGGAQATAPPPAPAETVVSGG
ncbi:MAG TPA: hypothetical protein VHV55_03450 [Pirellulales bacterium]|jgi:hypothetical protein|nr:hypothetical protein [Pirellulales bacterium]